MNIIGDPKVIQRVRSSHAGDPSIYANLEVIESLPEMFSAAIVEVKYKFPEDFDDVGDGNFMPEAALVNRICEARGISGTDSGRTEPLYVEVDYNRLLCKFNDPPKLTRMHVGWITTKQGEVLAEDGEKRSSGDCSVAFNAWERLCVEWGKEEAATNYYDPAIVKVYPSGDLYYEYTFKGEAKKKSIKYNSRAKRQSALDDLMKFAQRKSDTKARNIVIRTLTGMKTGYTAEELASGCFIFHKIQLSEMAVKMKQAAFMSYLSQHGSLPAPSAGELFTSGQRLEPETQTRPINTETIEAVPVARQDQPKTKRETFIAVIKHYQDENLLAPQSLGNAEKVLAWLESDVDAEKSKHWEAAIVNLKAFEGSIPAQGQLIHGLY